MLEGIFYPCHAGAENFVNSHPGQQPKRGLALCGMQGKRAVHGRPAPLVAHVDEFVRHRWIPLTLL